TAKSQALTHTGCPTGTVAQPIVKVSSGTSQQLEMVLNIYPNPNEGEFDMEIKTNVSEKKSVDIQIIDMKGNLVRKYSAQNENGFVKKHFNEPILPSGIYTIRVVMNKLSKEARMVIQKGVATLENQKEESSLKK
ncbi:MAG: T9SS type A sorting domain-containing protein, partial [Bacteroidota bacterium]